MAETTTVRAHCAVPRELMIRARRALYLVWRGGLDGWPDLDEVERTIKELDEHTYSREQLDKLCEAEDRQENLDTAEAIAAAAGQDGIVQAEDVQRIAPGLDPTLHTAMHQCELADLLGCRAELDEIQEVGRG